MKNFITLLFFGILASNAIAWENHLTHPTITEKAVERSVLAGDYFQTQLDLNSGLNTNLILTAQYQDDLVRRAGQARPPELWEATQRSIKNWLKEGSKFEDVPNPRARHHFHDPLRDTGLNNSDANPDLINALWIGSVALYWDYWGFDATGGSALKRAVGCADDWGVNWESEPEYLTTKYNWPTARNLFYSALTSGQKIDREKYLGSVFVVLGHICHLLEDMGVPAHTRNDFVWGHLVAGFYKDVTGVQNPWQLGGHPFEAWMEVQISKNDNNIPGAYLARLMDTPPALSKYKDYWDRGLCELDGVTQWQGDSPGWPSTGFGNPPPEKSWGLAECSNYQFLSFSTKFKSSGLQSFPHPAKNHTRVDWYPTGPDGERQYYRLGYDVPHLARVTYTTFYAYLIPIYTVETSTTEEERVFEDYAKRTISRTVDYTTGLINYFFRGKLSVSASCSNAECNPIEIYITNQSVNTNANQTLKGGSFGLYWDENVGNRTQVSGLTVYDSNNPDNPNLWGATKTLAKGSSIRATFNKPSSNVSKYTLVYSGSISANPNDPDTNDVNAIAVCMFNPPGPPRPSIDLIDPAIYGCPGSVLLIEGSGFSKTPSNNIVLFEDANSVRSDVYGIVQAADVNGQWLKVELPYFYAEDVDYYWSNATVTVDGNMSAPYAYKLSNYVWLTICLWDDGTSIDDDFQLWVNGYYWDTFYAPTPEDPVIVEYGFWYEDEYCYVDTYLIDSYSESGGTLGVAMWDYVNRVIAYRWNSSSQSQEFLYDQEYWWSYLDYFGIDVLDIPGDGVLLDVYAFPTYTGDLGSSGMAAITIPEKGINIGKGEQLKRFVPADISQRALKANIPRKRGARGTAPNRIGTKK
ncbi:MAG: hypothetical protein JW749_02560 [Sedimentisphaerales bacterium]|nr:hypothetical protein [Sedimentisphaerales bacterium]